MSSNRVGNIISILKLGRLSTSRAIIIYICRSVCIVTPMGALCGNTALALARRLCAAATGAHSLRSIGLAKGALCCH